MNLKITHYNNFFNVKGILDKHSVQRFQDEINDAFENLQSITISLEGLESIDKYGVMALAKLHNESLSKHKQLSIIGSGCQNLFDHFKTNDAA
ncbi:STAS domain-containing protein [Hanstruepera ponticola]|uniref:STAS domain-containing protein n=1 Tax=Hanstruepera ponticola TaxID=2042995 RepID=UPI00178560E0|nr:STAS domain-containing protein [Hanstruepera ponticola]